MQTEKGADRACQPYEGPNIIEGITKNGNYKLKSTTGKPLRTSLNGCNLKRFHERSTKETELFRKTDGEIKLLRETMPSNQQFSPTMPQWRTAKCEELHLPVSKVNNERRVEKPLGEPLAVQQIVYETAIVCFVQLATK